MAMSVELEQRAPRSMLTELRQLVLAGCGTEMYEEALEGLLDEAISKNIRVHDEEVVLKRVTRNLIAAGKASRAAAAAEDSIMEEGESKKKQAKADAEAKDSMLENEKMKRKNLSDYSCLLEAKKRKKRGVVLRELMDPTCCLFRDV